MKVIAHRGASAYLPEHTLPAKALAHAMGADYLEQDVVATRDEELIVLHDIHLDRVTNVADHFPKRARDDGRYYVIDFDLAELRQLRVHERVNADGAPVYPGRYPLSGEPFTLHTLAEELSFVRGLNKSTGRNAGVYPEIKRPAFHRSEGIDITTLFLNVLRAQGYTKASDPIFVQCFDAAEIRRIHNDFDCELKLVQLIGDNAWQESDTDYDELRSAAGIASMAEYVDGFGPWINQLVELDGDGKPVSTGLAERIHAAGCEAHPYTLRRDDLPPAFSRFDQALRFLRDELQVEAVFTDFPDLIRA
ncbi:MAG: glycerophosphodiester phosphodiesterase [Woeseiaceae bacterium]|nr:glycerophosphodiester phosphodiesterase [Woeseiaceae bacterium]